MADARWTPDGPAPTSLAERLAHTVSLFPDEPDGRFAVMATHGIYGPGVTTGLTWGDLRELARRHAPAVAEETDVVRP
jgi:hypothetical protein